MTDGTISPKGQDSRHVGYAPLSITLIGFKGIRSGLGRDALTLDLEVIASDAMLVAIAGANGRGKTTLLENLHPLC
jgi:DNA repair protein SbcC/Rad50